VSKKHSHHHARLDLPSIFHSAKCRINRVVYDIVFVAESRVGRVLRGPPCEFHGFWWASQARPTLRLIFRNRNDIDTFCSCPCARSLFVQRSLSVLLPVKNAQSTLNQSVHEILEVVADSSEKFEILIIDDGSTDATSEVAHELRRHYPQIKVVRHSITKGRDAAIRTGLERSQGEVVMLRDDERGFCLLEKARTSQSAASRPARPNYLSHIKNFTLGE
jgi:hypothetical protein